MKSSVRFLGQRVDADGLHPLVEKVEAIVKAPTPRNLKELKSFLGLLSLVLCQPTERCFPMS